MPDLKMVKACPNCDNPSLSYRKGSNDYYCYKCKLTFCDPVIRASKIAKTIEHKYCPPALPKLENDLVRACPNCDNAAHEYNRHKRVYTCKACGLKFTDPVIRKSKNVKIISPVFSKLAGGLARACPECDNARLVYHKRTNDYYCMHCGTICAEPIIRKIKTTAIKTVKSTLPNLKPLEPIDGIQMVRACPSCDSTNLKYQKQTNGFHCIDCNALFTEVEIRPMHEQPLISGVMCPHCNSHRTELCNVKTRPYWRCHSCKTTFEPEVFTAIGARKFTRKIGGCRR